MSKKTRAARATSKIPTKKSGKKPEKRTRSPKKVKRETRRKPIKKTVKKALKRATKTPVKKTPKRATKTPVKKAPKRATKTPVKKAPKRATKTPVKKAPRRATKAPVKKAPRRATKTPVKASKRPAKEPSRKLPKRPAKTPPAPAPTPPAPAPTPPKRSTQAPPPKRDAKTPHAPSLKPQSGEQLKARKTLLGYINRLGKRKAARRLDTTVAEVESWLRKGTFPAAVLPEIIGLGEIGGGFTSISGTSLTTALKKLGAKQLATLTGVPVERLKQLAKRNNKAKIKIGRKQLAQLGEKLGWEKLGKTLDVAPGALKGLAKHPQTDVTFRLREFVSEHGEDLVAYYIGLTPHHLKKWLETNVPRDWEADLNRIIGRRSDQGVSREEIRARLLDKRSLKTDLEEARAGADKWNKSIDPKHKRFHITNAQAKRWGQLRTFKENLDRLKQSYDQYLREKKKKKDKPVYPAQPPITPPITLPPPLFPGGEPPPLPVPPKKPQPIPMTEAAKEALADFLAARTEALAHDKHAGILPMGAFNRYNLWQGISRHGFRFYGAVRQFVILCNLTAIGNKIITEARNMWALVNGRSEFMTIRFTFSAQGSGNPFYPGAFEPDKNEFNFFNRNTDIMPEPRFIERAVRSILHEAWEVAQETLLFFEHYEIVKSVPYHHKDKDEEEK